MLSLKRLLIKLCGRTNFRIIETTTPEFAVSAGGTKWVSVVLPGSGKPIAIVGYMLEGTYHTQLNIYNWPKPTNGASFAVRNLSTSDATATLTVRYLVVD